MKLSGRTALVTGAAGGIGRGIAQALAARGCDLALADVDEAGLAETAALVANVRVSTHRLDVADRDAVAALPAALLAAHGRLDLLVELYPSPGMTDSVTTVYLATGCTPAARDLHGPEEEHSRLLHIPLEEAIRMIEQGAIADAKSVAGLLLTDRRLRANDLAE